jgi:RecB family exonuclease
MTLPKHFSSSASLQDYLLNETGPGALVIVPHRRLARQVWHKQRLANLEKGRTAWEPLPLVTLPDWWSELFQGLWPPYARAPSLVRLALWRQAIESGPPLDGVAPDQEWAQALDDAHDTLLRHALPLVAPGPGDTPLVGWRRGVTRIYRELLREQGWLAPGEIPAYLLAALEQKGLPLPDRLIVVGLETTAPVEERWLEALASRLPMTRLLIRGNPGHVQRGVVLPDREEEMAWVASRLLACHHDHLPLHRLAVTSPVMDRYGRFPHVLRELLGAAVTEAGCAYNLSQGPRLTETPLWNAALLPLAFLAQGERREDLVALLLSPYYRAFTSHQGELAFLDRRFREQGAVSGWRHLKDAAARDREGYPALAGILGALDDLWSPPAAAPASGRAWTAWLEKAWQRLGFPGNLDEGDRPQFERTVALLGDFSAAFGDEALTPAGVLAWLRLGSRDMALPGPGVQEAGIQVLGWLEMRGLDFDRVFCLGMNSGSFPGAVRPLPLLSRAEREQVLGGTQESQDRFAREQFDTLLGAAPQLILTRPAQEDQEPQVGSPFFLQDWQEDRLPILSQPDGAWVRASLVIAARRHPAGGLTPPELAGTLNLALPEELRVTQVGNALGCRCRFVLQDLLGIRELPEIEAGLDPRERGQKIHAILARLVARVGESLPSEPEALALLKEAAREVLGPAAAHDLHWQAEWLRWFGDEQTPGLLPAWLALERERLARGWRWLGAEVAFAGLTRPGWAFTLRGRLDRLDFHPEDKELMIWDYKTGVIPSVNRVFAHQEEFQLPAYLWAVREGHTDVDPEAYATLCAGFIGLKSSREDHLKYQDYVGHQDRWAEVLSAWEEEVRRLGEFLVAGDVRPAPRPAPRRRDDGACRFCPFPLVCNFTRATAGDEEEA